MEHVKDKYEDALRRPYNYSQGMVGKALRYARTRIGMSQVTLGKMIDAPNTYICHWEHGRHIPAYNGVMWRRIQEALGMPDFVEPEMNYVTGEPREQEERDEPVKMEEYNRNIQDFFLPEFDDVMDMMRDYFEMERLDMHANAIYGSALKSAKKQLFEMVKYGVKKHEEDASV